MTLFRQFEAISSIVEHCIGSDIYLKRAVLRAEKMGFDSSEVDRVRAVYWSTYHKHPDVNPCRVANDYITKTVDAWHK